ncbi:winged helix-turn-helix transcriptional regulator [Streptomyces chiangmaiensis]|uniref:Helix-turn-helix domain-containing protein n=1 Tax=Streptomyces chiangmaiensis TaxID=766497 RepID=A0ABU7FE01_9ACTN|nr:helix-turn-helix domain-containing protein [Streptomyces chiangmaiensis]MED7822038.1 helix-turn-helix domain-containing protein [Streptomyces chiangmaiensis]
MARAKRPDVTPDQPVCSIERSLALLGDRWTLLVVREAFAGATRFSDFRDALGIATDLLTQRLGSLVDAGVMERRTYQEPGRRARFDYHLTQAGRDLRLVLGALQQWGDRHRPPVGGPSALRRSRTTLQPLDVAFVDGGGAAVDIADVEFVLNDGGRAATRAQKCEGLPG